MHNFETGSKPARSTLSPEHPQVQYLQPRADLLRGSSISTAI